VSVARARMTDQERLLMEIATSIPTQCSRWSMANPIKAIEAAIREHCPTSCGQWLALRKPRESQESV